MEYKRKAVFFDRDGVINVNKHYVFRIQDFNFVPGIFSIMETFQNDFLLFIVTNQSGVARGYFSESKVQDLHRWMLQKFQDKNINIEKVFYCPHHPDFTQDCDCRKPKPGMIMDAAKQYSLDLGNSIMIGDNDTDILAAEGAGVGKTIKVESNDLSNVFTFIEHGI